MHASVYSQEEQKLEALTGEVHLNGIRAEMEPNEYIIYLDRITSPQAMDEVITTKIGAQQALT